MTPRDQRDWTAPAVMSVSMVQALRLIAIVILLIAFSWLAVVAAGDGVLPGDVRITRSIQDAPIPAAEQIARFGNWIGSFSFLGPFTFIVLIGLIWRRWRWDAVFLAVTGIVHSTNSLLKWLIDSPRPTPDLVTITVNANGNGFPSGHATGSTLIYGALAIIAAHRLQRPWLRRGAIALCLLIILIVGFARIKTGAHWPSDVLGGYLWGLAMLLIVTSLVRLISLRGSKWGFVG